jgi:lysophospholipase L1-like esterase
LEIELFSKSSKRPQRHVDHLRISRILLVGSGCTLILVALLYTKFVFTILDPDFPIKIVNSIIAKKVKTSYVGKLRQTQLYLLLIGVALIVTSELAIRKFSSLKKVIEKRIVINILLLLVAVIIPLTTLEVLFRPLASVDFKFRIPLYQQDPELGWKLRPTTRKNFHFINNKGLKGPVLSYAKQPNTYRILFLGDSVTFGSCLRYNYTFPYQIEAIMKNRFSLDIETINAGVDGYSPWQEYIYLKKEGTRYNPDLIVVSFVLNDVTEKFRTLKKFGGTENAGIGFQLFMSRAPIKSFLDRRIQRSGLVFLVKRLIIGANFGFKENTQEAAKKIQQYNIRELVFRSNSPHIVKAWQVTLANLSKIFDFCHKKGIPVLMVVFPANFQFDSPEISDAPQKIVTKFANEKNVPVLDLFPILLREIKTKKWNARDLFLDDDELHLNQHGAKIVAKIISSFICKNEPKFNCNFSRPQNISGNQ